MFYAPKPATFAGRHQVPAHECQIAVVASEDIAFVGPLASEREFPGVADVLARFFFGVFFPSFEGVFVLFGDVFVLLVFFVLFFRASARNFGILFVCRRHTTPKRGFPALAGFLGLFRGGGKFRTLNRAWLGAGGVPRQHRKKNGRPERGTRCRAEISPV